MYKKLYGQAKSLTYGKFIYGSTKYLIEKVNKAGVRKDLDWLACFVVCPQ